MFLTWQTLQNLFSLFWMSSLGGLSLLRSTLAGRLTSILSGGGGDSRSVFGTIPCSEKSHYKSDQSIR